ncbi:hypothetical protein [Actinophytocola sp.]|uniref:hypothetical protein n=1 Tax=Actinophytocola sp. TaxID=1872138 RepID=UPI003D6B4242
MSRVLRVPAELDAWLAHAQEQGWTDGLPVVPPTKDRVHSALERVRLAPDHVVAVLGPGNGAATVLKIAANAVLAGCPPDAMPVLVAAVEAIADPRFGLTTVQVTTNPATAMLVVNGPARDAAGLGSAGNCLGGGPGSGSAIGRALRLVMRNVGGATGILDAATQGQPAKLSFALAENEEASPWDPYHVDCGFDRADGTVTVVPVSGTQNMLETTTDPVELLTGLASSIRSPTGNDYLFAGEPWLVLCPEHATLLAAAGYTKQRVREALWELSKLAYGEFSASAARYRLTRTWPDASADDASMIPVSRTPADIRLVVAGGGGVHSTFLQTIGVSRSATRKVCR